MTNATQWGDALVLKKAALAAALCAAGAAQAENAEHPLAWQGLTLYGTADIGASYQSHGRPQNDYYSAGVYYFPNRAATGSSKQFSSNGLSQSVLGLRGQGEFAQGWSALFKLESAVNPLSLKFTDSQRSLTQNNGKPITEQTAAADNSLTGAFSMAMYAGVKSAAYGTLTVGRQNTPLKDNLFRYDPLGNAAAFSAFGAFGTPAGGGSTENARLNDSLRYQHGIGGLRVDAVYAPRSSKQGGTAWQLGLGGKFGQLSVDGVYAQKKGALVASSLAVDGTAATSVRWLSQSRTVAGYGYAAPGSVALDDALAGTVSDNRAWGLFAKYEFGAPLAFAGYQRISYANPASPRAAGFESIGGYTFALINNGAYATDKVLDVQWLGVKYQARPGLNLMAALYHYRQDAYTGNACAAPAATAPGTTVAVDRSSQCASGAQRTYSLAATYKFNSYLDGYVGVMRSRLSGGMGSGFAHASVYNAMTGVRMNF